jgi:hypothetical protein
MTVCFKIFGDDATYTFGTFSASLIPTIIAALAGRQSRQKRSATSALTKGSQIARTPV